MRSWSIRLFPLFGITIYLHGTFLLLLLFFALNGWQEGGLTGALLRVSFGCAVFTCVLMHEYGHCLTARAYGIGVERILLLPIGGVAQFQSMPKEPVKELLITAAGPAVNFVLAGLCLVLLVVFNNGVLLADTLQLGNPAVFVSWLLMVNLAMGVFNLLPIFPMDGGRLLRALAALRFSYVKATRFAAMTGRVLSIGMILFVLLNPHIPFFNSLLMASLFAFILIGGHLEYTMVQRQELAEKAASLRVADVLSPPPPILLSTISNAEALERLKVFGADAAFVSNGAVMLGLVTYTGLEAAARQFPEDAVAQHIEHEPRFLQHDWPLEMFVQAILQEDTPMLPVYAHGNLIGVVYPDKLLELLQRK